MKRKFLFAAGIALFGFTTLSWSAGQTSTNFAIPRDTLNAGVANMSSTNFIVFSSVGDAVAGGTITSVGFQLSSGFRGTLNVSGGPLQIDIPPGCIGQICVAEHGG